jgi:hypothetical protein
MSPLHVTVEQYTLSIDAADTVRAVLQATDTAHGDRIAAALHLLAESTAPLYVADLNELVAHRGLPPAPPPGQEPPPPVSASTVDDALAELARVGAVTVHPVWTETSTEAYLSEGRRFTLVQVLRPLVLIRTEHAPNLNPAWHGWRIAERTSTVPAGWYLLGETGDITSQLIGAGKLHIPEPDHDTDAQALAEALTYKLVETDGFGASRCDARCNTCHTRWYAESGSWHFTPDTTHSAPAWDYDHADGFHDDGTITCPACRTGRVGFTVT